MSKLEVGKVYKNGKGDKTLILCIGGISEIFRGLGVTRLDGEDNLGYDLESGDFGAFHDDGSFMYEGDSDSDSLILVATKTITIDGKDIEISNESFQELKKQLTED